MLLSELLSLQSSLEKPVFKLFEQQKIACSRDARMSHSREQTVCSAEFFENSEQEEAIVNNHFNEMPLKMKKQQQPNNWPITQAHNVARPELH